MTVKSTPLLLLLAWLMQPLALMAVQTDTVAFDQARLRIWCETTRFVYVDNNADSLMPSINCQSWETLRSSMKQTDADLGMSRLVSTIDKPAIYKGFSTNEAKLQKLVTEITNKLKQSPARRASKQRLNSVDSLQQQLLLYVRGTSVLPNSSIRPDTAASSEDYQEEANLDELPPAVSLEASEDNSSMSWYSTSFSWNEILQWLALLIIGGLVFWRLQDVEHRYKKLKSEFRLLEKQVNEFMINTITPGPAMEIFSEQEVRKVVKEEIRQSKNKQMPAVAPDRTIAANATKADLPPRPTAINTPASVAPEPAPVAKPVEEPVSREVPPVQNKEELGLYYDKMPFRGGFHQNEMSRERQRDSLYTIQVSYHQPNEAEYWISEDMEVQRYAMQNGMSFFEEGCEFTEVEENPTRVVNEQKGRLRKDGTVWKIIDKAKVRFE